MLARSAATGQADARDVLVEEAVSGKGEQTPSFEQTPRKMAIGIACVLIGGTCWGVNGAVSKILMEMCIRDSAATLDELPRRLESLLMFVQEFEIFHITVPYHGTRLAN